MSYCEDPSVAPKICPNTKWSVAGSAVCSPCPPGNECVNGEIKVCFDDTGPGDVPTWNDGKQATCTPITLDREWHDRRAEPYKCNCGQYSDGSTNVKWQCKQCSQGYRCYGDGNPPTQCAATEKCPAGFCPKFAVRCREWEDCVNSVQLNCLWG